MKYGLTGCFTSILLIIAGSIIGPIAYYFCGYICGIILEWLIGNAITNGLNYIFDTTRFAPDMLPIMCGTANVIASFFKTPSTSSK